MVTRSEAFPSRYLKAEDVGNGVKWTMMDGEMADFKEQNGITKRKMVISFQESDKLWVLNLTNWNTLEELFGSDSDEWIGREIVLYSAMVPFGTKTVAGIRCRAPKRNGAAPKAQISSGPEAKPVNKPPLADADMDDEVPF